ncbi:unnamed protein product [Cyclocybe aegerita]|uniref:Uncharacterized protein n=1 Tax=Cyclocybe aegerita TaxID=1973307 RepID=A0A8S0VXZ7_CYCAE|nr:unnamed protein product [Cyclocybe aegerita]
MVALAHKYASGTAYLPVFGRSLSPGPSGGPPSSLSANDSVPDNSSSYKPNHLRASSHSPTASTSTSLKQAKKRQSVSPAVVTGILNSMYAHPANQHIGASPQSSREEGGKLRRIMSSGTTETMASRASGGSRSSSSRKSTKTLQTSPLSRSRVISNNAIPVDPREPSSSDGITAKGQKAPSTTSSNDTSELGSLRVVGRGGSGSRPRIVAPQPDSAESPPRQEQPATFYRPTGRGGLGSRQRPINPTPPLLSLLPLRKKQKGKEKSNSLGVHPISPHLAYQITNDDTSSTLSSLHFTGETGEPAPKFFPSSPSLKTFGSDVDTPPFSATSSTFESISSIPSETDSDLHFYQDDRPRASSDDHRTGNMNKLARTLGDLPSDSFYDAMTKEQKNRLPKLTIEDTDPAKPKIKISKRSSLHLSSMFIGRPVRIRESSATLSTMTNADLHQLGLSDQISESWGEVDAESVQRSESPGSPITFAPPSPAPQGPTTATMATLQKSTAASSLDTPSVEDPESGSVTPLTETPTSISRSHSFSHDDRARRRSVNGPGHPYSSSTSLSGVTSAPTTPFTTVFPNKANWLIPPSPQDEEALFAIKGTAPDKPQAWTGEWNSDMQDVIRALRHLR